MRRASALLLGLWLTASAAAQTAIIVPVVTIYPKETIRADMLEAREADRRLANADIALDMADVVGKVSRTTLLPGRPVALNAVETPRIVAIGARVRIVFRESGVMIVAQGVALQPGGEGETIRVRNSDSALIVSGTVRRDGSIDVGSGG